MRPGLTTKSTKNTKASQNLSGTGRRGVPSPFPDSPQPCTNPAPTYVAQASLAAHHGRAPVRARSQQRCLGPVRARGQARLHLWLSYPSSLRAFPGRSRGRRAEARTLNRGGSDARARTRAGVVTSSPSSPPRHKATNTEAEGIRGAAHSKRPTHAPCFCSGKLPETSRALR